MPNNRKTKNMLSVLLNKNISFLPAELDSLLE